MKKLRMFAVFAAIVGASVVQAMAQTAPAPRIAVIDSYRFTDEKVGIIRIVSAFKQVNSEATTLQTEIDTMTKRLESLARELDLIRQNSAKGTVPIDVKTAQAKADEASQLERDIKFKTEDAKAKIGRRQQDLIGPVLQDVGKALGEFAKQKGYSLIFDVAKDDVGLLVAIGDEKIDVTSDFIAYFNARQAPAPPKP